MICAPKKLIRHWLAPLPELRPIRLLCRSSESHMRQRLWRRFVRSLRQNK